MESAKIFWSGRSQAVRLPKDFRFEADEVRIRRHGNAVILEPIANDWVWLAKVTGPVDETFVAAALEDVPEQDRPEIDVFK
jgi:antitoxin VapB